MKKAFSAVIVSAVLSVGLVVVPAAPASAACPACAANSVRIQQQNQERREKEKAAKEKTERENNLLSSSPAVTQVFKSDNGDDEYSYRVGTPKGLFGSDKTKDETITLKLKHNSLNSEWLLGYGSDAEGLFDTTLNTIKKLSETYKDGTKAREYVKKEGKEAEELLKNLLDKNKKYSEDNFPTGAEVSSWQKDLRKFNLVMFPAMKDLAGKEEDDKNNRNKNNKDSDKVKDKNTLPALDFYKYVKKEDFNSILNNNGPAKEIKVKSNSELDGDSRKELLHLTYGYLAAQILGEAANTA